MTNISNIAYGCLYITASISKDTDLSSSRVGSHWLLRIEWLHIWSPGYLVLKPFQKMVPQSRMSTVGLPKKSSFMFSFTKKLNISQPQKTEFRMWCFFCKWLFWGGKCWFFSRLRSQEARHSVACCGAPRGKTCRRRSSAVPRLGNQGAGGIANFQSWSFPSGLNSQWLFGKKNDV